MDAAAFGIYRGYSLFADDCNISSWYLKLFTKLYLDIWQKLDSIMDNQNTLPDITNCFPDINSNSFR